MCKCCQYCLESCYWHLIEKRFCYDESIALYEVPEKEEKNNNMFDNMAFFDSVAVIAGRSIVTIDPLPQQQQEQQQTPIMKQPTRSLRWEEELKNERNKEYLSKSVPVIYQSSDNEETSTDSVDGLKPLEPSDEFVEQPLSTSDNNLDTLKPLDPELRRKSLRERRLSKSLYVRFEQPKELPLIRQQSMPKFYLDTPDEHYSESLLRSTTISATLSSPVVPKSGFVFDLYSVVQIEKERELSLQQLQQQQLQQKKTSMNFKNNDNNNNDSVKNMGLSKNDSRASRLASIRERIKLRRVKSTLDTPALHLPHSHNYI